MKKAFTLIELLAVIIILAVIALIATPVVLKVVDNAKESARKSSVSGYADTVRLALVEKQFETGISPNINQTFLDSLSYQGEEVSCSEVINSSKYGVILHECNVGSDTNKYCFVMGKVYECGDETYTNIYNEAKNGVVPEPIEYVDNSGANKPELYDKMIPVVYNTTTNKWQYTDINEKWYDYDEKWWANAVVLNPDKSYDIGQDIEIDDIAMFYVWIPRYKYTIFNGNNESILEQEIRIEFEIGTGSTGTVTCTTNALGSGSSSEICTDSTNGSIINNTSKYTHPAFTFGTSELSGIWVGKFEVSTTNSACLGSASIANCNKNTHTIKVIPNTDSLRFTTVSNLFTSIINIRTNYSMNNVDSHMIRNMEWGATSYLAQSKYGRCTNGECEQITINNIFQNIDPYTLHTGCAGDTVHAENVATCLATNRYETEKGVKASTTGNIYGIYDMSGGAYEYVMGNMVNTSASFYSSSAGFGSAPNEKYYDKYTYRITNTFHSRGRLGDATKETLNTYGSDSGGWYGNLTFFSYSSYPWFFRGGYAAESSSAGMFYFFYSNGAANYIRSTRSVLVAN